MRGVLSLERRLNLLFELESMIIEVHFSVLTEREQLALLKPNVVSVHMLLVYLDLLHGLKLSIDNLPHSEVVSASRHDHVLISRGESHFFKQLTREKQCCLQLKTEPVEEHNPTVSYRLLYHESDSLIVLIMAE